MRKYKNFSFHIYVSRIISDDDDSNDEDGRGGGDDGGDGDDGDGDDGKCDYDGNDDDTTLSTSFAAFFAPAR